MFNFKNIYSHSGDCVIRSECQRQKKVMKVQFYSLILFNFKRFIVFRISIKVKDPKRGYETLWGIQSLMPIVISRSRKENTVLGDLSI